jgi:hypothetical protein|tara:strand:- start:25 stop:906 length:882 start_codon:yes stop_codon:yes gene_type:complete|eukprot:SAG11_NODE_148_length_14747_cov_217.933517_4_plen_294_part_00
MADSATTRNRLRKQSLGSNVNTWGDTKLNEVLDCVDQITDGVETIALSNSSDYTLTTSNYTVSDQAKQRVLWFTGSLSSAVNVIMPSVEKVFLVYNVSGANLTIKTSSGAGVTIPTGFKNLVYSNGSVVYSHPDYFNGAVKINGAVEVAGKVTNLTTGTADSDAVNKGQMDSAIAASTSGTGAGTVKVTSADTTNRFLGGGGGALQAGSGITLTVGSAGADETLTVASSVTLDGKAKVSTNDTTPNFLENKIVAGSNITVATLNDGGNETVQITGSAVPTTIEEHALSYAMSL